MSQQRAGPPAPLRPAITCNECRIGIAYDFHGNGLIGKEKRNHVRLFMPCKACLGSIDKLFGQERLVTALGSIGGTRIWGRSLRKLISSPSLGKQDEEALRIVEQATG